MKLAVVVAFILTSMMRGGFSPAAHAEGDPAAGKTVFNKCAVCHTIDPAKKGVGPALVGVVGRHSATLDGYAYSPAMKAADKTWDGPCWTFT
jgi:cytochrome c